MNALELHQRGIDAANARRFAAARRALTRAEQRTDDPDLRARIAGTMSFVLSQIGEPDAAQSLCRQALARDELSTHTRAVLSGQLGALMLHAGRSIEAEELLTSAERGLDEETVEHARVLVNRSVVRMQRHDLTGAADDLRKATALYEQLGAEEARAEAQHNLGYVALLGGDLVSALALMSASRPVFEATNEVATAIADLDRSEVLRDAGLVTDAEELLAEVAQRFGAQRMRQARGEAEFHLARTQLRADPAAASRTARAARRRFERLGSDGWAARASAVELEARQRSGKEPSSEEYLDTVRRLRELGLGTEAATLDITSRHLYGGAVRVPKDAATPVRLRAYEVRAQRALRAGRLPEACTLATEGLALFTEWKKAAGSLDLQTSLMMHGNDLLQSGLTAAARRGSPEVVFEWAEHARHLGQQITPVRPPHDPELADDLAEIRMLRADLAGSDWTNDARVRALRDRIRERQWRSTTGGTPHEAVSLEGVQTRLDAQTAVVSWLYTGTELRAVTVTAAGAATVALNWDEIRPLMDGLRADLDAVALVHGAQMAAVVQRSLDDRAARLDALLLQPIRDHVAGAMRWVLTVPGVLGGIPWALLPTLHGVPFTIATSVTRWLASTPRPLQRVGIAAGPRVERAASEAEAIAALHPSSTLLTGTGATVDAVSELAGRVDLLHVAAHGTHHADNPLFSGLDLIGGTLFGYDVDLITTVPDTVVLSACELGRSALRWHQEAIGMARVWLHAGARCVVASTVLIPDAAAAELLPSVHRRLAAGIAPANALAAAQEKTGIRVPLHCYGDGLEKNFPADVSTRASSPLGL